MTLKPCDVTIIMPPMWHVREPWTAPAYIVEALRTKGHTVQFLDYNVRLYRLCERLGLEHLWTEGLFFEAWSGGRMNYLAEIPDMDEIQGSVVGISVTQTSLSVGIALAERIRARFPNRKIIMGGHALFFPQEVECVPPAAVDAICKGEGEGTIIEVMERGFNNLDDVRGLYLPRDGGWRLTSERPLEQHLDNLAWPRFEGIDLEQYGKRFLPLMGARGCVGRCVYCQDRYRTPGFRVRSAQNQVDELEYLSQRFRVEHFPYNEPLMNGSVKVLSEKADEILRRNLKVRFGGNMMVRPDMPAELFQRLGRAGMTVALIGVESGSEVVLKGMRKRHSPEMAERFLQDCHNAGIKTEINILLGFPTETEEEFLKTCDFVRRNAPSIDAIISITSLLVYPSDLYDAMDQYGITMRHKRDYGDWTAKEGGNTPLIRQERVRRFRELCGELGLLEDHVMGWDLSKPPSVPRVSKFIEMFESCFLCPTAGGNGERSFFESAASRLRKRASLYDTVTVSQLAGKALKNFKYYGLSKSLKRGVEWWKLRRG